MFGRQLLLLGILVAVEGLDGSSITLAEEPLRPRTIRAGTILTMDGAPLRPGIVTIDREGTIVGVNGADSASVDLDLGDDCVLMPGLIDAYSRLGVSGGDEVTDEVSPAFRVIDALDPTDPAFRRTRAEGVTASAIFPGTDNVFAGRAALIKTAITSPTDGPTVVSEDLGLVMTVASDPARRNSSRRRPDTLYNRMPTNRMGVHWILRSRLDLARRGSDDPDLQAIAACLEDDRPIFAVARTDIDIESLLRMSEQSRFTPTLIGAQEGYKAGFLDRLAEREIPVILGPLPDRPVGFGTEGTEPILNLAGLLHEREIRFAFSGRQLLEQARFAVRFGLDREAALRALTIEAASVLGVSGRIGTIAPGLDADLVILSGDPLQLTTRVLGVVVDGAVYDFDAPEGTDSHD